MLYVVVVKLFTFQHKEEMLDIPRSAVVPLKLGLKRLNCTHFVFRSLC